MYLPITTVYDLLLEGNKVKKFDCKKNGKNQEESYYTADILCKTLPIIYARANIFLGEKIA